MIIRYLFSLLFWLHYSSKPEESIKIRRRYCHSIQRTYCHNRHGLAQNPGCPCGQARQKLQNLIQNGYCTFPSPPHLLSSRTDSTGTLLPAGQQYQRQSLVIWTLTSDRSGTSLHSIFWLRVLCRMPFLKHPPHFIPGLGPAQLSITEQLISLRFTFNNKFGHHDRFST